MVGMFNGAKKIKVLATFEIDGEIKSVNIVLPEGNWIFVNVGAMGFDQKGYMSFDNPYVGAKDNAPTSKEE